MSKLQENYQADRNYPFIGCQEAQVSGWLKAFAAASAREEAGQSELLKEAVQATGGHAVCPPRSIGKLSLAYKSMYVLYEMLRYSIMLLRICIHASCALESPNRLYTVTIRLGTCA